MHATGLPLHHLEAGCTLRESLPISNRAPQVCRSAQSIASARLLPRTCPPHCAECNAFQTALTMRLRFVLSQAGSPTSKMCRMARRRSGADANDPEANRVGRQHAHCREPPKIPSTAVRIQAQRHAIARKCGVPALAPVSRAMPSIILHNAESCHMSIWSVSGLMGTGGLENNAPRIRDSLGFPSCPSPDHRLQDSTAPPLCTPSCPFRGSTAYRVHDSNVSGAVERAAL